MHLSEFFCCCFLLLYYFCIKTIEIIFVLTASHLSHELGLHGEKIAMEALEYYEK